MTVLWVLPMTSNQTKALIKFIVYNKQPQRVKKATKNDSEIEASPTCAEIHDQDENLAASYLLQMFNSQCL